MNPSSLREFKFTSYNTIPSSLVEEECTPFNLNPLIDPLYKTARRRVLVVFDHVPTEDLRAGRLCSGAHGHALKNLLKLGKDYAKASGLELEMNIGWAVASYNYFKTYHLESSEKRALATKAQNKRLFALIDTLKPHVILTIGNGVAETLTGLGPGKPTWVGYFRGHVFDYKKDEKRKVVAIHDFTLRAGSSDDDDDDDGDDFGEKKLVAEANLLGYASRCASTVLTKKLVKPFSTQVVPKPVFINTLEKFKSFFAKLMEASVISIDSETEDLARITNRIQTLQFAMSATRGYVLPILHRDSPWKPKELEYIRKCMRKFFGRRFDPLDKNYKRYLIGQNFKFDMSPIREWLGLYAIYWPVWDIQAGEYSLDENIKQAASVAGTPQYNLRQIALNYGITAYEDLEFGKDDRATIAGRDLDEHVITYGAVDVQVPFAIHELQLARARGLAFKNKPYDQIFRRFLVTQMNNLVKIESYMEGRGVYVDAPWLRQLQLAQGPLEKLKTELWQKMRESPGVQKANKRMMKRLGVPSTSLWGGQQWVLDLGKPEHKQCLFIDTLGLEPVMRTAKGQPSINKVFFKKHAAVPEVAAFSEYTALEKLSNTYVSKVAKIRRENRDMRKDGRLRPSFGFTETVTGRSNSYDPNLQQIPSRGKHAKLIKRLFVAPPGSLVVKMDYSAHEIRIWSVISGDEKLGQLFAQGRELRQKWRATEKNKYLEAIETVGDIHKLNCVAGSTLVPTNRGLLRVDEIAKLNAPGSKLIKGLTVGGRFAPATVGAWTYSGKQPTIVLTTELGNNLTVTRDHLVLVLNEKTGETEYRAAGKCAPGTVLVMNPKSALRQQPQKLKFTHVEQKGGAKLNTVQFPTHMSSDLAFLIGCIVAEASIIKNEKGWRVDFTNTSPALIKAYTAAMRKVFGVECSVRQVAEKGKAIQISGVATKHNRNLYCVSACSKQLVQCLEDLGLYQQSGRREGKIASHFQVVPSSILRADQYSQLAFLAAYLECDGTVENGAGRLHWFSTSRMLMEQMQVLLNAHGVFPKLSQESTCMRLTLNGVDSLKLWPKLIPYMPFKRLECKPRTTKSGIPFGYWKKLVASRLVNNRGLVTNDAGQKVQLQGFVNYPAKVAELPLNTLGGEALKFVEHLKTLSKKGYDKLQELREHGYVFTRVTELKEGKTEKVYDLSIKDGEPSFIANGLVVHNCQLFFGTDPREVTKEQRDAVKGLVFGSIYGMGPGTLAANLGKDKQYVLDLLDMFFSRYKKASAWLKWAKQHVIDHNYVYSPIGRRRNMYAHLYEGAGALEAAVKRMGSNSPIQGWAADMGHTAATMFLYHYPKALAELGLIGSLDEMSQAHGGINVMVHDSISGDFQYDKWLVALQVMQWCATRGCMEYYENHFGTQYTVPLEVEFELGADDSTLEKWDWSDSQLLKIIDQSLESQLQVYPDLNCDAARKEILRIRDNSKAMKYLEKNYPILA